MTKSREWSAWKMGDEVRVQINHPDIAKAFGKVKSTRLVGYSVCGKFTKLFHVKESVEWVEDWMKKFLSHANSGAAGGKETR